MIIKRCCTALMVMIFTMSFLVVSTGQVKAEEQIQTQSMIQAKGQVDEATQLRLRLRSQLKKETGLTDEELDAKDPFLAEALSLNGGQTEPIRKMVRKSLQVDCVTECFSERLRTQKRLMLQEHKELAEDNKVASQDRLRAQTRTRDGEQSGDTTRTETQTRTQNQDGSGSGSGGGGGKGR
ncbi:MAG: hypothetical protein P1S59_11765 [bacterium]|nr:hypothetical protein [bacterium]